MKSAKHYIRDALRRGIGAKQRVGIYVK